MERPGDEQASGRVQIRDLDDSRLEDAVRLWETGSDGDAESPFTLAEVIAAVAARQPALVAQVGDQIVGAVAARIDGKRAWVLRWSVAAESRRRGVGADLLRTLERRLHALGVREISMLTAHGDGALSAAQAIGYVRQDGMQYLEKRRLHATAVDDRLEELGGSWPSDDLWTAIGGMEREKELIERRVILPLAEREEARRHGVVAASAVILFGPPGTGKTTFAKAIAGRLGWAFTEVFPSQLAGADAHGRAGALRELFAQIQYLDRIVVFIDEVEEIASHRQERPETRVIANELLKLIPTFRDGDSRLLVVATNSVRDLDHAFTRPGRFDYLLPVGPPDRTARMGIWQRYVAGITDADVDLGELAERSQFFSAADIEFAARKAAQAAFERSLGGAHAPAATEDFVAAIAEVRPSITDAMARESTRTSSASRASSGAGPHCLVRGTADDGVRRYVSGRRMDGNRGRVQGPLAGVAAGCLAVAAVTGAVAIFEHFVPVLSLGVLYVFAVLPVAVLWGIPYGIGVAVASMLTFNFLFLPPVHSLTLADRRNWFALAVYVTTAIVVGGLASSARRRRDDAEQREREAALLADIAAELLRGAPLDGDLGSIAGRAAGVMGVSSARIALGEPPEAALANEAPYPMSVNGKVVGTLYVPQREEPALGVRRRLLPALASLLAVARERERLSRDAFETEALRRSDAIKTAVIQAVSHDLRTPLATIEQALDGLESGTLILSDHDRRELLDTIRIEHARLKRFVENLLDLSRLQAGAAQSAPELWTGEELVAQALEEPGVDSERVRVDGRPDLPPVSVDAVQVQRVLVNLLENALSVSPPGESVHVRVSATRKELLIRVTDRGPGVPDEERERIFEPFHRIAGRSGQRGAGLGLTIARGFTEANGGRLWVESRTGQGASFVLALPAVELPVEVPA